MCRATNENGEAVLLRQEAGISNRAGGGVMGFEHILGENVKEEKEQQHSAGGSSKKAK